jgi:pyridoxine kinase
VPTVLLSNHPRYPTVHGRALEPELVAGLLRGVEERGLIEQARVLISGYLGSAANAAVVADFVARAKARNPDLVYVCDPVMGDDDSGVFVAEGLIEAFRDRLVPMASIATPNQYELELLSGHKARGGADLRAAADALRRAGTGDVVVTGCVLDDTAPDCVETIVCTAAGQHRTATARLPIRPCGTGDLFTALMTAHLCQGLAVAEASARATAEVFAVLQRTFEKGSAEMVLIGS